MGKNNQAVLNTLTVLETCVKNCDRRFHYLVAQKEFAQDLVKLIGPKYDPPQAIQEKVLSLIQVRCTSSARGFRMQLLAYFQCWADAFRGQSDLKGVCEVYDELKSKGIEFPMTDLDAMAPIYTPKRSVPPPQKEPFTPPAAFVAQQHSVSTVLVSYGLQTCITFGFSRPDIKLSTIGPKK